MPIYKLKIRGRRKPVLVKADSSAEAKNAVVEATSLKADEMAEALAGGEKVWNTAEPLPADDPEPQPEAPKGPATDAGDQGGGDAAAKSAKPKAGEQPPAS